MDDDPIAVLLGGPVEAALAGPFITAQNGFANPNGAQTQQLATEARTYPAAAAPLGVAVERTITILANTSIQVRITDSLTSATGVRTKRREMSNAL